MNTNVGHIGFDTIGSEIADNSEAQAIFQRGFGNMDVMPDETYYNPMGGVREVNKLDAMAKAFETKSGTASIDTDTGGTFTASALFPPFLDPSIMDKTVFETPLVAMFPRKAVNSLLYVYNLISAKAGAAFLGSDAPLSEQVDTRDNATVSMKYLYAVGRVLGPALRGSNFTNLLAEDLRVKSASMNEALENEIINGNTTTNPFGFQGLIQLIDTNSTAISGDVDLDDIRAMQATIFQAKGKAQLGITDAQTLNKIKGQLMDFQRFIEKPTEALMPFGIPGTFMIDETVFIRDQYMPTSSGSRRIIFVDLRYLFLAVLQDITFVQMGITNDSQKYFLKWYGSFVIRFESAMGQLTSIN